MVYAHKTDQGEWQTACEHLCGTAQQARSFGEQIGAGALCEQVALAHDIGKYTAAFQKRLEGGPKVDHSTAGAKELFQRRMLIGAFCVAGHHAGLPDGGTKGDGPGSATLMGRLKKDVAPYDAFGSEISLTTMAEPRFQSGFDAAFFARMVYSCLVDADFLDTEAFMRGGAVQRGGYDAPPVLLQRLTKKLAAWEHPTNALNQKRCEILHSAITAAEGPRGLYTLTVPTGGGKTAASFAFALHHAVRHGMERVIYVIPFTSIIEQTAEIFRDLVGAENVLEHHANVDFDAATDDDDRNNRLRLSTENWDAPIVVTTNVQFFESLFANRSSRCRKLHNIAHSVVIFDEAQALPLQYLRPSVRSIENLVKDYGVTAVLCTATQPALEEFFGPSIRPKEICPDTNALYDFFRRTKLIPIGRRTLAQIAGEMAELSQVLTIVNTRASAAELFSLLPEEGRFHLSTLMIPLHRRAVLEEIRRRLKEKKVCRVVATSLVEAGVDLDFPQAFREEAGLDSLIQAAGRCNREGKNPLESSIVKIFSLEKTPPPAIAQNIALLHEIMVDHPDLSAPETIRAYFDALHSVQENLLDKKEIIPAFERGIAGSVLPFATVAERFRWIDTETRAVLIPWDQTGIECAAALRAGDLTRELFRTAGNYFVNLSPYQFQALVDAGVVELETETLAILNDLSLYSPETGLSVRPEGGAALFF